MIALASEYGRYGYKKITALLQMAGWKVGRDRVERIWWREGLKVPKKQRPRKRLWLNDGSCNGPELVAKGLRKWLGQLGTGTLYIEPGSPWKNAYCESFNGKLRDECLNGEIFYSLLEAQIVIGNW